MRMELFDFRHAREILEGRPSWTELYEVAAGIERRDILQAHEAIASGRRTPPAGGQSALNKVFRERLEPLGWEAEPRLFASADKDMRKWKMDFIKGRIGVEVSFNHAEAIPWTFTRLNLAGESERVSDVHTIDVGVAFFAMESLKQWARMDGSVGTFQVAKTWLSLMKPIMPIPILVVGLDAEGWDPTESFRGTRQRG